MNNSHWATIYNLRSGKKLGRQARMNYQQEGDISYNLSMASQKPAKNECEKKILGTNRKFKVTCLHKNYTYR